MNSEASESAPDQALLSELGQHWDGAAAGDWLAGRPALLRCDIVRQLAEAVRQEVRVDLERALRLAELALAIARKIDDIEALGLAYRAKANALWFAGKLTSAVEMFQLAVDCLERAAKLEEVGRTLSSCIQPLILLGEYDRALQAAERARGIFLQLGDQWRLGRLDINVANIHHRQDRFTEALDCYQSAYERLQPYKDQEAMAAALHNMAVCLIMLNDFDRALETYQRARRIAEDNNMPRIATQADYNIAYLRFLRGDYHLAIDALRITRERCEQNADEYHLALCDLDESELYLELNLSDEAAAMAGRARERFEKLKISFEAGRSVVNSAIALYQRGELAGALALFAEAEIIFKREGNTPSQALVGLYRAMALWDSGDAERAAPACAEALDFFVTARLRRREVLCRLLLARIAYAGGQFLDARRQCETALQILASLQAPLLSYHAHLIMGDLHQASGAARQSYGSYQKARHNLEGLRASLQGEELKIAFMKNRVEVYEKLVGLFLERGREGTEKAFSYMELAKSRILAEAVYTRGNPVLWPKRSAASDQITTLRQELNWYYRRLEVEQTRPEGISLPQIEYLQAEARSREDEIVRALRRSPVGDGGRELKLRRSVSLEEIHASLQPDATLVEYFQVGSRLLAAVLARGEMEIVELGNLSPNERAIRMLDFQLSGMKVKALRRRGEQESKLLAITARLQELYRNLLAPLVSKLRGNRLVIVPHGILHYLPFHALHDGTHYLIDRFVVSYAPSAGIHALCRRKRANSQGPSLLLGVSDNRAPWVRQEIRSIAEVLPDPVVRMGREATASVLKTAGVASRFIHIATHGLFRRDNPMFSSVRLADSYLNIYDLYELTLPAELLTLSGCGTGLSVVAAGDELLGLIRGLISAGATSLLLTLWDVHDRTTAGFMACFYRRLQAHGDKGLALREAMLALREDHPHPYYWAPFVLVGDGFSAAS
jgi:CHAT domain-containing protein/tetratricopeptide (TPR) repeat protein